MNFSNRGFVSILLAFAFAGMAVSGILLYFSPPCGVAERAGWSLLGLSKNSWLALHLVMSLVFLILGLVHLFCFNWRPFVNYLRRKRRKAKKPQGFRWEMPLALLVFLLLIAATVWRVPPVGWLLQTRDEVKTDYRESLDEERERQHRKREGRGQN